MPFISFDKLVGVIGGVSTAVQRVNNRIAANNILNEKLKASEEKLASIGKLIDNSSVDPVALENFMKDNYPDQYKKMSELHSIETVGKVEMLLMIRKPISKIIETSAKSKLC